MAVESVLMGVYERETIQELQQKGPIYTPLSTRNHFICLVGEGKGPTLPIPPPCLTFCQSLSLSHGLCDRGNSAYATKS